MFSRHRRRGGRERGVTLIELILFIMIIGIALAGLLRVLSLNTGASADPVRRKQALMIAESLMEEVQLAGFTLCDPASSNAHTATAFADCTIKDEYGQTTGGETPGPRPYDNVNDYVNAAGTAVEAFNNGTGLADANGELMEVQGYTASVTITAEPLHNIASGGASANVDVLRIAITVSYDNNESVVLDGYRTRYAPVPL